MPRIKNNRTLTCVAEERRKKAKDLDKKIKDAEQIVSLDVMTMVIIIVHVLTKIKRTKRGK